MVRSFIHRHLLLLSALFTVAAVLGLTIPAGAVAQAAGNTGVVIGFGDSVAAGYQAGSPSTSPYATQCARTDAAYPTKVAAELGFVGHNLACSGATTSAGLNGPQITPGGTVPGQLDQAKSLPRADLATLTIVANDVNWQQWLAECIDPTIDCATAANTVVFRAELAIGAAGLAKGLYTLVYTLKAKHVSLTGYYDPMGSLAPLFGLAPDEIDWYRARLNDVNTTIQGEAELFPHVNYVPVSLNAAAGDVQLSGPGIFHPTDQGQTKYAADVEADYAAHAQAA
jgi:hypothetical protein